MAADIERSPTGVPGLDEMMHGGFIAGRFYLVDGNPGSGKTTLALQYLLEGGEPASVPVRHAVRNQGRARGRRAVSRLVARRHRDRRARRRRAAARRRIAAHDVPPVRGRAHRDHAEVLDVVERTQAAAHGVRFALRAAAAGAELRCAIAGRSSPSSSSSPGATAPCCCSTTAPPKGPTCSCRASRTA